MGSGKRLKSNESGVVESSLVMIPLLTLFLMTLGLIVAVNFRNIDASFAQSDASIHAINGSFSPSDEVVILSSRQSGKSLRVVVSHRGRALFGLNENLPLTPRSGSYSTDAIGVAVIEENP